MSTTSDTVQMNIALPASLAKDLRQHVPSRKRDRFVAQAVARELQRLHLQEALDASAGAWQDADHPELADGPAIDRWLAEGRASFDTNRSSEA